MKTFAALISTFFTMSLLLYSCAGRQNNPAEAQGGAAADTLPAWQLVWADEFNDPVIDTNNWSFQVLDAGTFNQEWQRYTDQNAYIADGNLVLEARHEGTVHGPGRYSSARMHTANKQSWQYGKFEARIKLPGGNGIWPAFWMLGANIDQNGGDTPWPQSGEIDILEFYGSRNPAVAEANIHFADENDQHAMMGAVPYTLASGTFPDDFHVFTLEWDPQQFRWYVDGEQFAAQNITDPVYQEFHQDYFILLNIAVGGQWAGQPDESTQFPKQMLVDWVRVYQQP